MVNVINDMVSDLLYSEIVMIVLLSGFIIVLMHELN